MVDRSAKCQRCRPGCTVLTEVPWKEFVVTLSAAYGTGECAHVHPIFSPPSVLEKGTTKERSNCVASKMHPR
jgi:hypothetical protein